MPTDSSTLSALLTRVRENAERAGVFGPIEIRGQQLVCRAKNSAAPASYRLEAQAGTVWLSLVMADRWLSESIESDLVEHGDKIEDLLEEELIELGMDSPGPIRFEHYRSDDMLFTFRSPLPIDLNHGPDAIADTVTTWLLAYEACFRNLGDMDEGEGE